MPLGREPIELAVDGGVEPSETREHHGYNFDDGVVVFGRHTPWAGSGWFSDSAASFDHVSYQQTAAPNNATRLPLQYDNRFALNGPGMSRKHQRSATAAHPPQE